MSDDERTTMAMDGQVLHELARHGETRHWEAGDHVVREGEPADCLYVIHEGELRAFVSGGAGRSVELASLGPGEMFGELMLSGQPRSATVQALTRVRLTRVQRRAVEQLLVQRPALAFLVIQRLVGRVRALTRTAHSMGSMDVYQRIVDLFDEVAVMQAGQRCVTGMSQQRIAERVGASRTMVNRLLHDLARGGYITMERGCITLLRKLPPRW